MIKVIQKNISNTLIALVGIKWFVVMMIKFTKEVQYYRGENAVYKFMEKMLYEVNYCKKVMKNNFNKPLKMTDEDEQNFKKAIKCHICDTKYTDKDIYVRDHCHITQKYRGSGPGCSKPD